MAVKDGGSAFPVIETHMWDDDNNDPLPHGRVFSSGGMTLRDWFAGQALPFALSASPSYGLGGGMFPNDPVVAAGRYAYRIADAMLTA